MLGLPVPRRSGMNPDAIAWKSLGNGPIDCPFRTHSVRPRNTSIPASVTMNEGIFQ